MKSSQIVADEITAKGFSLIELLVVMALITILSAISLFYLSGHQKLYKPDDQSLQIIDILQEARQRALTERVTMRIEIDLTANLIRLVNEKTSTTTNDDSIVRQIALLPSVEVRVNNRPSDITYNPPEPLPAPTAVYAQSTYPLSANNQVCTIRFLSNGSVVNAGNNNLGNGAIITGVTLHIWSPSRANPNASDIARALTIIGSTGSIRLWNFDRNSTLANKWIDSRRIIGFAV